MTIYRILICTILLLLIYFFIDIKDVKSQTTSLVYSEFSQTGNLNPYENKTIRNEDARLMVLMYEGLFRYDYNVQEYKSVLAESIDQLSGNRFQVIIKSDVYWHDGIRLTAEDIKFTYDYIRQESKTETVKNMIQKDIQDISVQNESVLIFTLSEWVIADPMSIFTEWILPKHLMEGSRERREFSRSPIGTGPFKFQSRNISGNIELIRNNNYHGKLPEIESVKLEITADYDTATLRLLGRVTDMLVDVPSDRLESITRSPTHRIEPYQSYGINVIGFNFKNSFLNDRNVREAMLVGFDRKSALQQWFENKGSILGGPFTPNAPYFNPNVKPRTFSVNSAKQILQNAGYTDRNGDKYLQSSDGTTLEFDLLYNAEIGDAGRGLQNVVLQFQTQMRDIGIKINLQSEIKDRYDEKLMFAKDFDLALIGWNFDPTYDISQLFHSSNIFPGGTNVISYRNQQVDNLFDQHLSSFNNVDRLDYMYAIQNILAEDIPYLFMFTLDRNAAIDYRFINTNIDPLNFFTFIKDWEFIEGL